ncbi:MAG: LamB/YcsF family protein [Candidatus Nephthysia bennettiae]|uniref:LamB/YcsF family protein n=1 Tax=Candidatus Nephthysia bennettiae TaxID=3127016 RepID=A0A934N7T3_9BACT|nr:LamB/YcsF family protein [Candidatus Dormibacteraeota bacterium]MBJ7613231.1 LamB/YcsF family protein [Candidatus Dormibacteraeota bacterium]PZR96050.1 MAG: LamB/YcsF family protein [Candidatus Dormibacteraeota bacterium]
MNLNSDLGEGAGHDEEILPFIDSANVGCGVHAGSVTETIETARRCRELGVEVGAHPSFDDRENYGRREIDLPPDDLEALVRFQVAGLAAVAKLGYLKAHGGLYHYCQSRPEAAERLARVAGEFGIGVMGQPGYAILEACRKLGVRGYREGFADRAYLPDGRLAPRSQSGSVLEPDQAAEQALRLIRSGEYDTICLHGDSPGAPATARRIREALDEAGIRTASLGT